MSKSARSLGIRVKLGSSLDEVPNQHREANNTVTQHACFTPHAVLQCELLANLAWRVTPHLMSKVILCCTSQWHATTRHTDLAGAWTGCMLVHTTMHVLKTPMDGPDALCCLHAVADG